MATAGTRRPSVPGTHWDRSTAAATAQPIVSASSRRRPVSRKSKLANTRPARKARSVRRPSSLRGRISPAAQAAPIAATSSRTIVPGLTCGNPSLRRELQVVSATDDPPVDRLTPATGGRQGRLASTKATRIQVDDQATLAAHPEVEQRLEPVFIGRGRDDDQPAAMAPLLPL